MKKIVIDPDQEAHKKDLFGTYVTEAEGQAIAEFLGKYWGQESAEEITDIRESMRASVIRSYMSDGPGYYGPVYTVVFGGGPEFHYILTNYRGEGLEIVEREFPPPHDPGCTGHPDKCDCF